jgi:hypothetical protein
MKTNKNDKAVFCTSCIEVGLDRSQNWINYYSEYFKDAGVDLWMFNDGPAYVHNLELKGVEFCGFPDRLGRQGIWVFPGWKRSFYTAIQALTSRYSKIAHIESDCWLTDGAKSDFLYYFDQNGYFTAWTKAYSFPEGSIQIMNLPWVRQYFLDKYGCKENWFEDIDFEKDLERLKPTYILDGDRIEHHYCRFQKKYNFVSGLSYSDFMRLYA